MESFAIEASRLERVLELTGAGVEGTEHRC